MQDCLSDIPDSRFCMRDSLSAFPDKLFAIKDCLSGYSYQLSSMQLASPNAARTAVPTLTRVLSTSVQK